MFKVGQRVVVLPLPPGDPRTPHVGKLGEIEEIRDGKFLVDDQLQKGVRVGCCTMRELYTETEIDHG